MRWEAEDGIQNWETKFILVGGRKLHSYALHISLGIPPAISNFTSSRPHPLRTQPYFSSYLATRLFNIMSDILLGSTDISQRTEFVPSLQGMYMDTIAFRVPICR